MNIKTALSNAANWIKQVGGNVVGILTFDWVVGLKNSSSTLVVRNAGDTANAPLEASKVTVSPANATSMVQFGSNVTLATAGSSNEHLKVCRADISAYAQLLVSKLMVIDKVVMFDDVEDVIIKAMDGAPEGVQAAEPPSIVMQTNATDTGKHLWWKEGAGDNANGWVCVATWIAAMAAAQVIAWAGRAQLSSPSDGKVKITNAAGTAGVVVDGAAVDGLFNIRNRADTAGGNLQAAVIYIATALSNSAGSANLRWVTGSPEGVVTAGVGSMALRLDGEAGTTLYIKESGTGNTGWVGK